MAPAWRPGHEYELAYVDAAGAVAVRDADTGRLEFSVHVTSMPRLLAWSADGQRLLVLTRSGVTVFTGNGRTIAHRAFGAGQAPLDAALAPDGRTLAILRRTA